MEMHKDSPGMESTWFVFAVVSVIHAMRPFFPERISESRDYARISSAKMTFAPVVDMISTKNLAY